MKQKLKLKAAEVTFLKEFKNLGHKSIREINRANILLLLNKGKSVKDIMDFLDVDRTTIWRTETKYMQSGVANALLELERSGQPIKYTMDHETELVALACSKRAIGARRWTVRSLTEELRQKEGFETINRETVRRILKKTNVSLG
jgi:putative transposase